MLDGGGSRACADSRIWASSAAFLAGPWPVLCAGCNIISPIAVNIAAGARGVLALCNISGCVVGLAETRGWC
jgi:hypothetical protein